MPPETSPPLAQPPKPSLPRQVWTWLLQAWAWLLQDKRWLVGGLFSGLGTAVIVYFLLSPKGAEPPTDRPADKPKPRFVVMTPILNPYERDLRIKADNAAAKRNHPLHIRYDGVEYQNAGTPLPDDFAWFVALESLLSKYPDQLKDGKHQIAMRFAGQDWSETKDITLTTKQATVAAEIKTSKDESEATQIIGAVQTDDPASAESVKVNIYFHHLGEPEWQPLDVTRKISPTGKVYFIFSTDVLKLPLISPDDPKYTEEFFVLEIVDRAGTVTSHALSYDLFTNPSKSRIGIRGSKDKALVEFVRGLSGSKRDEWIAEFKFIPATRSITERAQHHASFNLTVNQYAQDLTTINTLRWSSLPTDIRRESPLTIILRNDRQIASTFGNKFIDKEAPAGGDKRYEVVQRGRDGVFYKSNQVLSPFPHERFALTIEATPANSVIALVGSDITYQPGVTLPVGDYTVEVTLEGYVTARRSVPIVDRDVTVPVMLEPVETRYAFTIQATPADSTIKIMNIRPRYKPGMLLAPGDYKVLVEKPGYVGWQ